MKLNNEWVLQKYIKGLYIPIHNTLKEGKYNIVQNINKNDKLHKFHLRVNLLYFVKNNIKYAYFLKQMVSNIGRSPITDSNYSNRDAHNTHYQSDLVVLVFPDSYKKIISKDNIDNIYKQIITLFTALLYSLNTECYNATHCFHVYGIDILITPEYNIKLIEVNGDPGMNPKMFSTQQLINGVANLYLDNILDITEKQEDDNFIKLEPIKINN
jgi:hypothetical protein